MSQSSSSSSPHKLISEPTVDTSNSDPDEPEQSVKQTNPKSPETCQTRSMDADADGLELCTRIQYRRFICCVCGEEVVEQNLTAHHSSEHTEVPFISEMYELCEIDDQVQCSICNVDLTEDSVKGHMESEHPQVFWSCYGFSNENMSSNDELMNNCVYNAQELHGVNLYYGFGRTENAQPNFDQYNIMNNTTKYSTNQGKGLDSNDIFDVIDADQKAKDNGYRHKAPKGFHNVCISDSEYIRLLSHNRLYVSDGRLHVRDSKF